LLSSELGTFGSKLRLPINPRFSENQSSQGDIGRLARTLTLFAGQLQLNVWLMRWQISAAVLRLGRTATGYSWFARQWKR
jgi:hypothetical protein